MHGDEPLLQSDRADQVEKERLAGAVLADDEPATGPAVRDPVDVVYRGPQLGDAADLDVLLPEARDHAGPQRRHDRVSLAWPDPAMADRQALVRHARPSG